MPFHNIETSTMTTPASPQISVNTDVKHRHRAEMSAAEWKAATRFDSTDWGWVIMSIGMAIGAGIVFLPVQVGLSGLWVFLLSSAIGYPAMYLFQRLLSTRWPLPRNAPTIPALSPAIWEKTGACYWGCSIP